VANKNVPTVCRYCEFWDCREQDATGGKTEGACKRYPPSVVVCDDEGTGLCVRPSTSWDDYCGEWRIRIDA
jgi:hypothetical protein